MVIWKFSNTVIFRDVVNLFAGQLVPVLDAVIVKRVGFAESPTKGLAVLDVDPFSLATAEIKALARLSQSPRRLQRRIFEVVQRRSRRANARSRQMVDGCGAAAAKARTELPAGRTGSVEAQHLA